MLTGYAQVSVLDRNPLLQIEALNAAGCKKIFTEKISGVSTKRLELEDLLHHRYHEEFSYRFNRRFDLATMVSRLLCAAATANSIPIIILRISETSD